MSTPITLHSGLNQFPAGDFTLPAGYKPPSCEVAGVRGQTRLFATPDANGVGIYTDGDGFNFHDFTLIGAGIKPVRSAGGRPDSHRYDNIIFNLIAKECINIESGLSKAKITNCSGNHPKGWFIYGYNWNNCLIANNELFGCGMHIDAFGDPSTNADNLVEQNYGESIDGAFMEFQHAVKNLIVQDNDYAKPTNVANNSKYAWSIPTDNGIGTISRRNRAVMPTKAQQWPNCLIAFELGSANLICEDNYINGGNDVCAVNGTNATGVVRHNRFVNFDHMTGNNTSNKANATFLDNTPGTQLTWDITRDRPRPNVRYGTSLPSGSGGGTTPPPDLSIQLAAENAQVTTLSASLATCQSNYAAQSAKLAAAQALANQLQAALK